MYGPRSAYLTNLAAALLKMGRYALMELNAKSTTADCMRRYEAAESATTRALLYEPRNLKARYRRGLANKARGRHPAAIEGTCLTNEVGTVCANEGCYGRLCERPAAGPV